MEGPQRGAGTRSARRRRRRTSPAPAPVPGGRGPALRVLSFGVPGTPLVLWGLLQLFPGMLGAVQVGELALPVTTSAAELREHAERWEQQKIVIHTGPYLARLPRVEFGARLDAHELAGRLSRIGRSGNPLSDLAALWGARTSGLMLAWNPSLDRELLAARVSRLRREVERSPVPGTRTPEGEEIPGIPGITINSVRALSLLEGALRSGLTEVRLEFAAIAPPRPVAFDDPATSRFDQPMGSYRTEYRTGGERWGRARNVELAAAALNGAVLVPGAELSFNEVVGERSFERGYRPAPELANGRVVEGIGGGICQVAATLHAAAFLGGMQVPVQRPHSRPVRYIATGLDVMVAWPDKDLRIRNPYPFSVRFDVKAEAGQLSVELVGGGKPHPVEWSAEVVERIAAGERRVPGEGLGAGDKRVVHKAVDGLRVRRVRTVYLPTGPVLEERELLYPPHDSVVEWSG